MRSSTARCGRACGRTNVSAWSARSYTTSARSMWKGSTPSVGSASPAMVDAYRRCRDYLDAAISLIRPGVTTADVVQVWPKAEEFGFANEEAAFALQYGHGVGLSIWEKPIFSRLASFDYPEV